jgi:hypothetical protein
VSCPRLGSRRGCLTTRAFRRMASIRRVRSASTRGLGEDRQLPDRRVVARVGDTGTVPLGWSLYLPEDWCDDPERRKKAKIPERVAFQTKPQLGVELVKQAAGWAIAAAPVLGDQAYGENTALRDDLNAAGREYVLSVGGATTVFGPGTTFTPPVIADGATGRKPTRLQADQDLETIAALIKRLGPAAANSVTFRDGLDGEPITSRFIFTRVRAAHGWKQKGRPRGPARGMADRRMARGPRRTDRLLALQPPPGRHARLTRPPRPPALAHRGRLPPTQRPTRP